MTRRQPLLSSSFIVSLSNWLAKCIPLNTEGLQPPKEGTTGTPTAHRWRQPLLHGRCIVIVLARPAWLLLTGTFAAGAQGLIGDLEQARALL